LRHEGHRISAVSTSKSAGPAASAWWSRIGCSGPYEAAVLYDDLVRAAKDGRIAINFKAEVVEEKEGGNGE
jgi:hypothetical protein